MYKDYYIFLINEFFFDYTNKLVKIKWTDVLFQYLECHIRSIF